MFKSIIILSLVSLFILGGCSSPQKQMLWNGKDFTGWTLFIPGDSIDVNTVWSVQDGVIHCKGVPNGYMRTNASYSNYKLHLEWRWAETASNSGVLLHCQEPDQVWPNCLECQLQSGNAGDFVIIGPGKITVNNQEYNSEGRFAVIKKMQENIEKPVGEWNSYDIICKENTTKCLVNGVLQNEGTQSSFSLGPIGLQSEGAPIEFRNIYLVTF